MRLILSSLFIRSPFENLQEHAGKVKKCAQLFKEATVCHIDEKCKDFDMLTEEVAHLESEADAIKRNIRNHLPRGILMPVDKFQFMQYLKEQDNVLDEVEEALFWLSFRPRSIPDEVSADILHLVTAVIPTIEKLPDLVALGAQFFRHRTDDLRTKMKSIVRHIRQDEREADVLERDIKYKVFSTIKEALDVYHLVTLVDHIGHIADHAQNASDRMRTMIAK